MLARPILEHKAGPYQGSHSVRTTIDRIRRIRRDEGQAAPWLAHERWDTAPNPRLDRAFHDAGADPRRHLWPAFAPFQPADGARTGSSFRMYHDIILHV